jgi:cytoskeletal protein CcmA (bactofilin family)
MWGNRKKVRTTKIDSLIGRQTELCGDLRFTGGLHVDGTIKGNVTAETNPSSVLTLSEHGTIQGDVKVANLLLDGVVIGDVYAEGHIELASKARITGNVYYTMIEMAMGAQVNGNLVRGEASSSAETPLKLSHGTPFDVSEVSD